MNIDYRKKLKDWKACLSPTMTTIRNQEKINSTNNAINTCGEKPEKPLRAEGLNHEVYKQTPEYIEYRKALKSWKDCVNVNKKTQTFGSCGEKPKKPLRVEGLNHEEYKQTPEYVEYRKILKVWKDCMGANK